MMSTLSFDDQSEEDEEREKCQAGPITTTPSDDPNSRHSRRQSPEFTYEKSIQDYVNYSNAALAKQQEVTETTNQIRSLFELF